MTSPRVPGSPYESTEGEPAVLSPPIHTPQTRRDGAMTRNQRSCWSPANQRDSWSDTFRLLWWREEQITWFWCGSHVILTASFIMNELQGSWASSGNFIFTSFRCFLCLIVRSDPQPRRYWPPINTITAHIRARHKVHTMSLWLIFPFLLPLSPCWLVLGAQNDPIRVKTDVLG